ncbi:hypothetical protein GUITHDRAFT_135801 [Guillardia theta CCMP2712]|uniref:Uncharacterized protein n=1 Tax=Guillardia theta (strain CCMP2712) TaxID=905079 RepID=L1JME0_GUITC|nr:hypothetical protein GUITHDRAFT_135801 [Guillardia theta CCMP2712]EKX49612.1 hypothetical protein GUITHDRAFT_135801 [Guillardia theta CCMP2712]|eukprot:XP_005836592.1 hypothetical protein GUITHDRAFT_135801 [Guillardia theta CCMP2712]
MWSGLTSGFSNAIQSLDQAARDAIVANLGDEELTDEDDIEEREDSPEGNLNEAAGGNGQHLSPEQWDQDEREHVDSQAQSFLEAQEAVDAYDAPFQSIALETTANKGNEGVQNSPMKGLLGKVYAGGTNALSSVKSNVKLPLGEVGGTLWERSSIVRNSISAVTKDVASAMKEEIVGMSSTVGVGMKGFKEVITTISNDDEEWADDGEVGNQDTKSEEDEEWIPFEAPMTHGDGLEEVTGFHEVPYQDDDWKQDEPDSVRGQADQGSSGPSAPLMRAVTSNVKFSEMGSKLWEQSSAVSRSIQSVTKDVTHAMREELAEMSSTFTKLAAEDAEDNRYSEGDHNGVGVDGPEEHTSTGIQMISAHEGISMEVEGLEMEREYLQAQVSQLQTEKEELLLKLQQERERKIPKSL